MDMLRILVQRKLEKKVFACLVFVELVCGKTSTVAPFCEFGFYPPYDFNVTVFLSELLEMRYVMFFPNPLSVDRRLSPSSREKSKAPRYI